MPFSASVCTLFSSSCEVAITPVYAVADVLLLLVRFWHQMQDHPLAESAFGGLAGWKLGAVGVVKGEPAISAPLFRNFVVDAPEGVVSAAAINMHNLEVTRAVWGRGVRGVVAARDDPGAAWPWCPG